MWPGRDSIGGQIEELNLLGLAALLAAEPEALNAPANLAARISVLPKAGRFGITPDNVRKIFKIAAEIIKNDYVEIADELPKGGRNIIKWANENRQRLGNNFIVNIAPIKLASAKLQLLNQDSVTVGDFSLKHQPSSRAGAARNSDRVGPSN